MSHEHTTFDIACRHVAENERAILYVWRYSDGQFGMSCGHDDHPEISSWVTLCRACVVKKLPEFDIMEQLQPLQEAARDNPDQREWTVGAFVEEE